MDITELQETKICKAIITQNNTMKTKFSVFISYMVLSLLILNSFKANSNNLKSYTELSATDTIDIKLKENSPHYSRHFQYVEEDNSLFYYNLYSNTIDIYDLAEKRKKDKIELNDIVQGIDGFLVAKNWLYLILRQSNQVFKVNLEGETSVVNISGDTNAFLYASFRNPIIKHDNSLYITRKPKVETVEEIPYEKHEMVYNLKDESYSLYGEFPDKYKQENWWHFVGLGISKTVNKNQLFTSYPVCHNLYVHSLTDKSMLKYELKSKYLKDYDFPYYDLTKTNDVTYKISYAATLGRYVQVLYDPYRDLIYRIVALPQEYENEDGTVNSDLDRPWSIMVIDNNMNILFEQYFEGRKYNFYNILVTDEGLLVSNNHTQNPIFKPGILSFTVFTLN